MDNNSETDNQAHSLITLEKLILSYLSNIDRHQEQLKKYKEMLDSALENNPEYVEAAKTAKEAAQAKSSAKNQVIQQPEISKIHSNLKDGQSQLKEMRASLSKYLSDYAQLSGTNQFEDDEGEVHEIIYIAKVVKRSNKFRT